MKYFTMKELTKSATAQRLGINNTPGLDEQLQLHKLVENILDPLREAYGKPIIVTSAFRCEKLNKAVGGSSTSQHFLGQAADLRCVSDTPSGNKELFDLIRKLNLPFDQLIWEYGNLKTGPNWVHVSYSPRNRRQVLQAIRNGKKTIYKTMK